MNDDWIDHHADVAERKLMRKPDRDHDIAVLDLAIRMAKKIADSSDGPQTTRQWAVERIVALESEKYRLIHPQSSDEDVKR